MYACFLLNDWGHVWINAKTFEGYKYYYHQLFFFFNFKIHKCEVGPCIRMSSEKWASYETPKHKLNLN